jgi:hypothetical protein
MSLLAADSAWRTGVLKEDRETKDFREERDIK